MASSALDRPERAGAQTFAEIALAYALLECALWSRRPAQLWWGAAMLAAVSILTARGRRNLRDLGLTVQGIRCSLIVVPITFAACGALVAVGWALGWAHAIAVSSRLHGAGYIVWAFVQQFM